jgi:hypothetical protein
MAIKCPDRNCLGEILEVDQKCDKCRRDVRTAVLQTFPNAPTTSWFDSKFFRLSLQILVIAFLLIALVFIGRLFFSSEHNSLATTEIPKTQALIAGVLLTAIIVCVTIAIISVLLSSTDDSLKDRVQLMRDILAPVLAIFGTVTGFYFGSNSTTQQPPGYQSQEAGKAEKPKAG